MPAKKRRRDKATEALKAVADLVQIVSGQEKRLRRLEKVQKEEKRPIGFYTDLFSTQEVPNPPDDEEEDI